MHMSLRHAMLFPGGIKALPIDEQMAILFSALAVSGTKVGLDIARI
jgi:hypothetical protein